MPPEPFPQKIKAVIFDMDGVLWRGGELLPGAAQALQFLRHNGMPYAMATNNSTATPLEISQRAQSLGLPILPEQIFTSSQATVELLRDQVPLPAAALVIGEHGLRQAVQEAGYTLTRRGEEAAAVLVGFDRHLTWGDLAEAAYALAREVPFLGTNTDRSFPTERGLAPGNGAILAALEAATGRKAQSAGKPEPHIFLQALRWLKTRPPETLVVGDRLETDILGGQRAGMPTVLVLTGVTDRPQLAESPIQPDRVIENLTQLPWTIRQSVKQP